MNRPEPIELENNLGPDAGMLERRLRRALWLARAEMARTSAWVFWNRKNDYNYNKWKNVERKCRAKAEEYK